MIFEHPLPATPPQRNALMACGPGNGGKLRGAGYALVPFSSPSPPLPPALEKFCLQQPLDCDDIYAQGYQEDGVYLIYPSGPSVPVPVFCDMTTTGGKWTVSGRTERRGRGSCPRGGTEPPLWELQSGRL